MGFSLSLQLHRLFFIILEGEFVNTFSQMRLHQNLDDFEAFYSMLDDSHAGLDPVRSRILDSQLVLLLANHIGAMPVLREAFALARVKLDMIRPAPENAD